LVDRSYDFSGLKCFIPLLKLSAIYPEFKPGEIIEVVGDCPTFEKDIKAWCSKLGKTILNIEKIDRKVKITIKI